MNLRISEIYLSIQGEGPRVGEPTIFVRFGGCNLKCPGWPCDSQFAIDPQYRSEWMDHTPEEVTKLVITAIGEQPKVNICLTGGEPFLQQKHELEILVTLLYDIVEVNVVECFSNGTLEYPLWAIEQIHFVMDWKLPGSGEKTEVPMRLKNFSELTSKDAVKFTIANDMDFETALLVYNENFFAYDDMPELEDLPQVFFGAVWGKVTNEELIFWVFERNLPWRLNVQVHNYVYDRNKRGI